jgi:hypothetical protein
MVNRLKCYNQKAAKPQNGLTAKIKNQMSHKNELACRDAASINQT